MKTNRKNRNLVRLGARLREFRKESSLTQMELAFKAELNPKYLGCVERGEKDISVLRLYGILRVLSVTPEQFFHEIEIADKAE